MTEALQVILSFFMNLSDVWPRNCMARTELLPSSSETTGAYDNLTDIDFNNVLSMIGSYTLGGF